MGRTCPRQPVRKQAVVSLLWDTQAIAWGVLTVPTPGTLSSAPKRVTAGAWGSSPFIWPQAGPRSPPSPWLSAGASSLCGGKGLQEGRKWALGCHRKWGLEVGDHLGAGRALLGPTEGWEEKQHGRPTHLAVRARLLEDPNKTEREAPLPPSDSAGTSRAGLRSRVCPPLPPRIQPGGFWALPALPLPLLTRRAAIGP